jgi:prepilin-type processing-associated H-X9-DG protein
MNENLVGYLLNSLDEPTHSEVAASLAKNPEARAELEVLRRALEPLAADREAFAPPPGLVARTLARIADHCGPIDLPQAPVTLAAAETTASRPFWRRADFLVAASLLLTFLGLGIPALYNLVQGRSAVVACQENLRVFHQALHAYHDVHGRFPNVADTPRRVAGMVVPVLMEAGTLPPQASVRCPGTGALATCSFTTGQVRNMADDEFQRCAPALFTSYSYSLGYRTEHGFEGPRFEAEAPSGRVPLIADCLPPEAAQVSSNSSNHGSKGQNVLFQDGHVKFLTRRIVGLDDDIYLNKVRKIAAGLDNRDVVLGPSAASP